MFVSQDQRHLLLNLAQQRIHLHEVGNPLTNTPSPNASAGPLQKYRGSSQEQRGRFVVRSCMGGINQAFVLSGSEDCKVCSQLVGVALSAWLFPLLYVCGLTVWPCEYPSGDIDL